MSDDVDLSHRLLELEPIDPVRNERFLEEIKAVYQKKLGSMGRLWWGVSLVAALAFAGWGTVVAATASLDPFLRVVWWIYAGGNVLFAIYAASVVASGTFDLRKLFAVLTVAPAGALLITIVLVARAASAPTVESLLWVVFAATCLMLAHAWSLRNTILRAELSSREQFLRLEHRVLALAERLQEASAK